MIQCKKYWFLCMLFVVPFSQAIVINNTVFVDKGGDINNTVGTYKTPYEQLRTASYADQFLAVGKTYPCTATWIGDSADNSSIYVLLAAHCVKYKAQSGTTGSKFVDYSGKVIGSGGTYYIPPQRLKKPSGYGGASTDIAILKLKKMGSILDKSGAAISAPVLNDVGDELGKFVHLVGYGAWGTAKDGSRGGWKPASGDRRAWGMSKITGIFEMQHGIGAKFTATGTTYWARTAPGDSGSAWWQEDNGRFYIVADTNGGSSIVSTGARISAYKDWIRSVAPEVKWRSVAFAPTVTQSTQ